MCLILSYQNIATLAPVYISYIKLWGVGENYHVKSSIIIIIHDQCYFYAKYNKNTSSRACF